MITCFNRSIFDTSIYPLISKSFMQICVKKRKSYENLCKHLEMPHLIEKPNYLIKAQGAYQSEFD